MNTVGRYLSDRTCAHVITCDADVRYLWTEFDKSRGHDLQLHSGTRVRCPPRRMNARTLEDSLTMRDSNAPISDVSVSCRSEADETRRHSSLRRPGRCALPSTADFGRDGKFQVDRIGQR